MWGAISRLFIKNEENQHQISVVDKNKEQQEQEQEHHNQQQQEKQETVENDEEEEEGELQKQDQIEIMDKHTSQQQLLDTDTIEVKQVSNGLVFSLMESEKSKEIHLIIPKKKIRRNK